MFNIWAFFSYVFVVSFTPGPNNIMSMANASKYGYKKTLKFIFGVFTGFFIVMLLSSYFNLLLFNLIPKIKFIMGLIGSVYMVYLAIKLMKSEEESQETLDDSDIEIDITTDQSQNPKENGNNLYSFFTGLTMQFVNPKGILYSITVISNFIIPYYKSNIALLLTSLSLALVAILSTSVWALFGSLFNRFLSSYQKQFNIVMGLLLIYSAITISGITHIFQ
ncbi:MAG: lysine transporter LysE [Firmicutes bacterium]|nr:lysine transporter LysE [Bacillota bacterium]